MDFQSGQNPFLMDEADYGVPSAAAAASSNPFLTDVDYDAPSLSENPFLSAMGGDAEQGAATYMATNGASTNPFAAFAVDSQPAQSADFYGYDQQESHQSVAATTATDFFGTMAAPIDTRQVPSSLDLSNGGVTRISSVIEPAGDYCQETSEIFSSSSKMHPPSQPSSGRSTPKDTPRRPPPPRPLPPEETKNLILSVTGAMEATSSHLLDRLPPTRTPSPTLLRDLQSPSPTPDSAFSDFLGVGGGVAPDTSGGAQEANLLGDLDDISGIPPPLMASDSSQHSAQDSSGFIDFLDNTEMAPEAPVFAPPLMESSNANISEPLVAEAAPEFPMPDPPLASAAEPVISAPAYTETSAPSRPGPPPRPPPARPPPARPTPPMRTVSPAVTPTAPAPAPVLPLPVTEAEFPKPPSVATTPIQPPPPIEPVEEPNLFSASPQVNGTVAPKNTTEIMNLFGADSAAVKALNSAPAQAADDFFGGGGGFPPEPAAAAPEASPFPPPSAGFGAPEDTEFDAFTAKFESASNTTIMSDPFDPFSGGGGGAGAGGGADVGAFGTGDAWGGGGVAVDGGGFGADESFDAFLSMRAPPVPQSTPARVSRAGSGDSDEGPDFSVVIKPQHEFGAVPMDGTDGFVPALAPPPKLEQASFADSSPRFNPFDKGGELPAAAAVQQEQPRPVSLPGGVDMKRTDSAETPPTPLFDEDTSYPLEDFPRINYSGPGWEMQLRQPNRKKITGQRFWKKIFIRLVYQGDNPVLQLLNASTDKDPFQELPLQPSYCVSDISAQQFDQYGKIFTVKLQYVFYKERPGVRPGQVTKAERITTKLSQFAAYAIQGDYQGCKEFASDLKKLGMPVEHAPQISQLFKIGSQNYEDMKQFSVMVEEALFKLPAHRDRALNYKQEEVQITAVDELYVEQSKEGNVERQIARVRLFFLGFLSGMPDVELGVNEIWRQGKEVVGRHDIIPVVTEEWIRLESIEFASCIQLDEYDKTKTIKFKPPDACYIELMRFRVRPPRNRELPLQLKAVMCVTGNKVELRADILVPGFSSRKYGQIPCEDICVRFPIPECWIYLFRVEKHFRYGSVKSSHRRAGKVKGIERFLGAVETMEQSLMEVTSGQAKYEHQHRSIVWRMSRLPKEGQGAYTTHTLVCRMNLTSYDQIPQELAKYAYVEFTMPQTQVSHTTVRSVSIQPQPDDPPEKYVRQLSRHEYRVEIEHTQGEGPGAYIAATVVSKPAPPEPQKPLPPPPESDSDSD